MEFISATLGVLLNDAAGRAAVFCRVVVGNNTQLLNGIDRRIDLRGANADTNILSLSAIKPCHRTFGATTRQ